MPASWQHLLRAGPRTGPETALLGALLLLVPLAAYVLYHACRGVHSYLRILRGLQAVPEAPCGHWLTGHAIPLLTGTPWDLMSAWVAQRPPLVRLKLLQRHLVVVGTAEGLRRVFQTRQRAYEKDLDFSFHPFLPILGTGLVTARGPLWQQQRLLMAPLLRVDILDDVVGIAVAAADRLSAKLEGARGGARPVDLEEEFRLLTLQVIGEAVASLPPAECDRVFPDLYLPVMAESNLRSVRPWREYLPGPRLLRHNAKLRKLDRYICGLLRERWEYRKRRGGTPHAKPDILDRLMAALEAQGVAWSAQLERQLCYEVKTFLLAGHETSASMLTWTLYELVRHPEALARVRAETGEATGKPANGCLVSRAGAEGMLYTLSALKESLRKYSVVPVVTRKAAADDELCGLPIPRGTYLACSIQAVHNTWRDPQEWRPERFLPGGEYDSFEESIRPFMFVPFIQGPRNCLGQYFALLEARIVLGLLVQRFGFELASKAPVRRHPAVIPVGPEGGMHMLVT